MYSLLSIRNPAKVIFAPHSLESNGNPTVCPVGNGGIDGQDTLESIASILAHPSSMLYEWSISLPGTYTTPKAAPGQTQDAGLILPATARIIDATEKRMMSYDA